LLLILYVIFWAFGVWSGTATGSATDAAFRLFRAFAIYTLATSWSDFVSFAYTLFNDGPSAIGNRLLMVANNNTYTRQRRGERARKYLESISQAFQAHVAFSLFSLGAYLVGVACVIVIALFLAVATFTIISRSVLVDFAWASAADDPDAALQRLVPLLFRMAKQRRAICRAANAGLCLPRLLSHHHPTVFANLATTMSSGSVDWSALAPFVLIGLTGMLLLSQLRRWRRRSQAACPCGAHGRRSLARNLAAPWNGRGCERPNSFRRMARPQQIDRRSSGAARVKRIYGDAGAKALQDRLMKQ